MPTQKITTLVSVPLGGGLQESVDPDRRDAPGADRANNAVVRVGQSYQKAPGIELDSTPGSVGASDAGAKDLVVSPTGAQLVLGQNASRQRPVGRTDWTAVSNGYQRPANLTTVRAYSPRGHVMDVGVTYHAAADLYGVCWREVEDPSPESFAAGPNDDVGPGQCKYLIVGPDGTRVAGPYTISLTTPGVMGILPRIECITDGSGNAVFVLIGCKANAAGGVLATGGILYSAFALVNMGSIPGQGVLTATALSTAIAVDTSISIDSHSVSTHDAAYTVHVTSAGGLALNRIDASGVLTTTTIATGRTDKVQVFHNADTQSVIVVHAGTSSGVAGDAYICTEAAALGTAYATSLHGEANPRLYKHASSATSEVVYSGETLTVVGSNPGTLTIPGTASYNIPTICYDPQPWEGHDRSVFPRPRLGGFYGRRTDVEDPGGSGWANGPEQFIEEYFGHLEGQFVHSGGQIFSGFDILEGRHSSQMWYGLMTGSNIPNWTGYVGHVPQTCVDGNGVVCLATHVTIPAIKAYARSQTSGLSAPYVASTVDYQNEGGWPNMDRSIVISRMSPRTEEFVGSVIDQNGTQVLAVGGNAFWDGNHTVNYVPRPYIVDYLRDTDTGVNTDTSGLLQGSTNRGLAAVTGLVDGARTDKMFAIKLVLVYTDRNGVEWRSEPSPPFWVLSLVYHSSSEYPVVQFNMNSLAYFRGRALGGDFDVELYVTERDDGTQFTGPSSSSGGDVSTWDSSYYLCQRSPLLVDGSGVFYIVDLWEFAHNGSYLRPALPLYTDTGELAPVLPPASGVMARSGSYAFLVPSEFPYELWPSKPLESGRGPEFAPELILNVPSDSGGIVSLAGLNDRLYILCRNAVYAISTLTGPTATGAGGFGPIRRIHLGDGCLNHRCTVETPVGVFYTSDEGVRLIGQDGIVRDIGRDALETLGDVGSFVSGAYLREHNEVWWTAATRSVIFNTETGAWTSETRTLSFEDTEALGGELLALSGSNLYTTDVTSGREISLYDRKMQIDTTWLTFEKALGWFRCKRVHVRVRRVSGKGDIEIKIAYDYDDTVVDSFRFSYDGTTGWGNHERGGHFTVRPSRQKFDAIKITVIDNDPLNADGGDSEGEKTYLVWALTGIDLEVTSKQGGVKLQAVGKR